jgi:CubicO group peptidase (beta-lactamase class C family)
MKREKSAEIAIKEFVAARELAGAAALTWRDGELLDVVTVGCRDLRSGRPVERDTIFRIASMTKPVTTVAALMLLDEGRFALDDPITLCAPELANLRVLRDPEGPLEATDEARRSITFRDLLTHRSGLTYGDFHRGPIRRASAETLGTQIDNALTPDEWIGRVATLPLIDQPGAAFHYGISTDLLGFLIARLDGRSLGEVLARRVFAPLDMRDTGFVVSRDKRDRRAALCGFDADGRLTTLTATPGRQALEERPDDMTFESGGQGCDRRWTITSHSLACCWAIPTFRRSSVQRHAP